MTRAAIALVAVLALFATAGEVRAEFVIDTFDVPASPPAPTPHTSSLGGTALAIGGGITRTLTGFGPPLANLSVANGTLSVLLFPGEIATLAWTGLPMVDFSLPTQNVLGFVGFAHGGGGFPVIPVDVFVNGVFHTTTSWTAGGISSVPLPAVLATSLALVFTNTDLFFPFTGTGSAVVANPEPATMALLGIGMIGGGLFYRRRRRSQTVESPAAA